MLKPTFGLKAKPLSANPEGIDIPWRITPPAATAVYSCFISVAMHRVGYVAVDVSLFLSQLGYCVVYLIFVQQNIGPSLREAFPSQPAWLTGTMALMVIQVKVGENWGLVVGFEICFCSLAFLMVSLYGQRHSLLQSRLAYGRVVACVLFE